MRYNPIYETWVAMAEKRQARPTDFYGIPSQTSEKENPLFICPFCEGHEAATPTEIDAVSYDENGEYTLNNCRHPDDSGWQVRAIPNRYPFLESGSVPIVQTLGPYKETPNTGTQEVLIDVPFHGTRLEELNEGEFLHLVHFYHRRLFQLRKSQRWKYVQIFKNQGAAAGASMKHLHSQIAAIPMIPPSIAREQTFLANYHRKNGHCWHCEVLKYELRERWRLVRETDYFGAFCPFSSRFPGEIWIQPKRHVPCFVDSTSEETDDLALVLRQSVLRLAKNLKFHDFNLILRTSPWEYSANGTVSDPNFHWRLEVCPRVTIQAGFEMGTGCFVNPLTPENAAAMLAR